MDELRLWATFRDGVSQRAGLAQKVEVSPSLRLYLPFNCLDVIVVAFDGQPEL